ncbi:hypothetical protein DFH06DRAFT_1336714 [Mycena polygramma]|nr:hypothetical protein DFH06DRAFT_1336714 [Mycena polygramma]
MSGTPSASTLTSILRVALTLESLTLHSVRVSSEDPLPSQWIFPPRWNSLTLDPKSLVHLDDLQDSMEHYEDMRDHAPDSFFPAIMSFYVIPVFSSLSLRGTYPTETSGLTKYLSHVGSALHYLRLQSDPLRSLNESEAPPTGLQYSPGLRRLDLVFRGYGDVGSTVLSAVSHVRSRNLMRLDVIDDFGSSTIMDNKWRLLDAKLAEGQFTSLQVVNIHLKSASLVARISHLMASSEKRGILRIVASSEPPGSLRVDLD